jgi:broad specificity phosphatase PhoE
MDALLRVHLIRHAEVASHRGDLPLTEQGQRQAQALGRRFHGELLPGEIVSFLLATSSSTTSTRICRKMPALSSSTENRA